MSAPNYAQPLTPRIAAESPVTDERLNGIDFDLTDAERLTASMAMQRVRRQIDERNRADLARELGADLGIELEKAA